MYMTTAMAVLVILLISLWIYWRFDPKRRRLINEVNKFPGPFPLPLLGNGFLMLTVNRKNLFERVDEITKQYWPIYRAWYGSIPEVNVSEAEHIEVVLKSSVNIKKGFLYKFLHPWLGTGLLTSSGEKWHTHRKLLTPTFHFKIMENFQEIFTKMSQILVLKLEKEVGKKEGFDVYPYLTRCTLDIIGETAMGVELNAQENIHSNYVSAIFEVSELLLKRAFNLLLHPDFIFYSTRTGKKHKEYINILHSFSNQVIQERKKAFTKVESEVEWDVLGEKRRMAFLDMLLQASEGGTKLTDEEIREQVDTFMFEGHDTTSSSLGWTVFLLGNYPDVQERVFEEQKSIFQNSDRLPTTQDLTEMKYLERVIKESLRLYPSVPFIIRTLTEDIQVGEYTIPEGCQLVVHICQAHRNPKYFPDPDTFNPDNFLPERVQGRHPFAFVPFSAGSRNCIGQKFALQEEKTVLSAVVRHFRIRALQKPSEVKVYADLILRPQGGINVTLERR